MQIQDNNSKGLRRLQVGIYSDLIRMIDGTRSFNKTGCTSQAFFQNEQEKNIFKPLFANHKGKPIMTRKGNRKV